MLLRIILVSGLTLLFQQMGLARSAPGQVGQRIMALQAEGMYFEPVTLFERHTEPESNALWSRALAKATVLRWDHEAVKALVRDPQHYMALELPTAQGTWILDLEHTVITTPDAQVVQASNGERIPFAPGIHYRGVIRGKPGSLVAISVFDEEVMGLLVDGEGEMVLGRFDGDVHGMHVLYRENDLLARPSSVCHTPDDGGTYEPADLLPQGADRTNRCVRFYWEINHPIFVQKGGMTNTVNYITGLFNQSAILFDNDGISVTLSELFVWDVTSPYTGSSTSDLLTQFGVVRTSFNGDLAHLIGYAGGGGIAWLNTLCNSQTRYRMAYSAISSSYQNVPTYSWSVEVVTHEQGHNLGSRHTHACAWNGNNTAIDGCGPAAGYSEGSCAQGPIPPSSVGGTIMSYCHLTSSTIKFANGFGPQPTTLIVNRVNSSSCLPTSCGVACAVPGGIASSNITYNAATITWNSTGATNYDLRWRVAPTGSWTTVSGIVGTSHALTGLAHTTTFNVQLRSNCPGTTTAWSSSHTFTTPAPPCEVQPSAVIALKVVLEGAYRTSDQLMTDALRTSGSFPLQQPYTNLGFTVTGPGTIAQSVLSVTGVNAIVDWVLVELRSANNPAQVVEARVGLLQRDGDVVALNGTSPLGFCVPAGNYRVAVRHRNHLGCMTGGSITLSSSTTNLDLSSSAVPTHGTDARKAQAGLMMLWAGDTSSDGVILYTGPGNDRDPILAAIGGTSPTSTIAGYHLTDLNLDGVVRYTGDSNDRDFILTNIGGVVPTLGRVEQVP
jgi:hypothetical protein